MEQNNLILLACGFLGVLVHCLLKAKDLTDYAAKANVYFSFLDYLRKDWIAVSLSLASLAFWFLIFPEVALNYPKIENWIRISFGISGLFGSYIIQKFFSKGKSYISNIIDKKTNIADSIKDAVADGPGGSNPPADPDDK